MIREHIGRSTRNKASRECRPIIIPTRLGDFDTDVRMLRAKISGALLVSWELIGIPKYIFYFYRVGGTCTDGNGQRSECKTLYFFGISPLLFLFTASELDRFDDTTTKKEQHDDGRNSGNNGGCH